MLAVKKAAVLIHEIFARCTDLCQNLRLREPKDPLLIFYREEFR